MTLNSAKKKRIEELYENPPKDGRVLCVDEFGPLSIRPHAGKGGFKKSTQTVSLPRIAGRRGFVIYSVPSTM